MTNIQFHKGVIDASGSISNGWNLVKPNYWMYFGISLLAMLMIACIPCVNYILLGPITGGVYYVLLREMRGEPVDFGMMFKGFDKFLPTLIVGVIQSIPGILGDAFRISTDVGQIALEGITGRQTGADFYQADQAGIALASGLMIIVFIAAVVFFLISIAWSITFWFAVPIVMETDLPPIEAIKLSARAGWSNVGGIIVLAILEGLIALLGFLMACIGLFFVLPILYAANAFAYRQVFPMIDQPTYQSTPPAPDVYGGSFGRGV